MGDILTRITAWMLSNAWWIIVVSVAYFLVSLFFIRFFIIRIPPDYFVREQGAGGTRSFGRLLLVIGRNLLGVFLIIMGLFMSLPGVAGQGVLTILLGLTLTDFPGKRRLEIRIIRQPLIHRAINSLREKAGRIPLLLPPDDART